MPRKILLADDSVTAQNMGKKILSDAGYEVITVSNGSAALKKATELLPDIAVLDVYMPGYSGLEVCKQLKDNAKTAEIPILLTVGKLEPFKSEEALKARANAFIVKPFEATELLTVIRKIEDANANSNPKATKKSAKATSKASPEIQTFSSTAAEAEAPDPEQTGIEEGGWKNRLSMPRARKAEPEPEEDAPAMGTGFRDLTSPAPAEESGLRRESAFTADAVAVSTPETGPATANTDASLDISISKEEIAAIKAAVEILSGQGDKAPVLHVAAAQVEGMPRRLAPEPEESTEDVSTEKTRTVAQVPEIPNVAAEPEAAPLEAVAVKESALSERAVEVVTARVPESPATPNPPHWKAESVELTPAEAEVSLEREMQEALRSVSAGPTEAFNPESLRSSTEIAAAIPVDKKPILSETAAQAAVQAEPAAVLAVAASASGDSNTVSSSGIAMVVEIPSTPIAVTTEAPVAAVSPVIEASVSAPASAGFQDLRPVASATAAASQEAIGSPSIVSDTAPPAASVAAKIDPSAPEDEIDSRTKAQMDAAWSNWRDIRNTVVAPKVADQIEDVAQASTKEEAGARACKADTGESSEIASIVDTMLAEMRPKLLEEIAKKLATKKD